MSAEHSTVKLVCNAARVRCLLSWYFFMCFLNYVDHLASVLNELTTRMLCVLLVPSNRVFCCLACSCVLCYRGRSRCREAFDSRLNQECVVP